MFELWGCILLRMAWREKIIEILREEKDGLTRKEIAENLGVSPYNIRAAVNRLLNERVLVEIPVTRTRRVWKLKLRKEK